MPIGKWNSPGSEPMLPHCRRKRGAAGWAIRPGSARHRGPSARSKTAPPGEASSSNSKEGNRVLKGVLRGGLFYDPMHLGRHRPGLASWSVPALALLESGCGHCTGGRRGGTGFYSFGGVHAAIQPGTPAHLDVLLRGGLGEERFPLVGHHELRKSCKMTGVLETQEADHFAAEIQYRCW